MALGTSTHPLSITGRSTCIGGILRAASRVAAERASDWLGLGPAEQWLAHGHTYTGDGGGGDGTVVEIRETQTAARQCQWRLAAVAVGPGAVGWFSLISRFEYCEYNIFIYRFLQYLSIR